MKTRSPNTASGQPLDALSGTAGLRRHSIASCVAVALLSLTLSSPLAMADGGAGGDAGGGIGGVGGTDTPVGAGGNGANDVDGGGGGGAGVTGGDGGNSNGAGAGGTGGAAPGASGADGGDNAIGGGGGGGGAHGAAGAALPGGAVTGGNGGEGGDATSFGAGGGGAGGWGAVVGGIGNLGTLNTTVTGGNGGNGGSGVPTTAGGAGGTGGIGLAHVGANGTLVINAAVAGGTGGTGGAGTIVGAHGAGGAGITGSNLTLTMGAAGTVSGGLAGDGVTRADAITFTGGNNSLTFTNATSGLTGDIGNNGALLTFNQTTNVTVNNNITGSGAVTLTGGSGVFFVGGNNNYTGVTTINNGSWWIAQSATSLGAVGASSGTVVDAGGSLGIQNNINHGAESLTINGFGNNTIVGQSDVALGGNPNSSFAGDITLGSNASISALGGGPFVLTGGIDLAGNTVTLGSTTAGSSTLTINTMGISGPAGNVIVDGTHTTNFNANNSYTGTTTVNGGTLNLNAPGANQGVSGSALTIGDGAGAANSAIVQNQVTEQINNAAAVTIDSDGRLDLNNFNETIGSLADAGAGGGSVTLGSGNLTTGGDGTSTTFSGVIGGTGGVTKTGAGTFTLSGANTYTGNTAVNQGQLDLTGSITSNTTVSNAATIASTGGTGLLTGNLTYSSSAASTFGGVITGAGNTVTINGAGILTLGGVNTYTGVTTVSSGGLDLTGSITSNTTVSGAATIASTGGTGTLTGNLNYTSSANSTFAGVIAGAGRTVTKSGAGILTLSGANTYTGNTAVNAGQLNLTGSITSNTTVSNAATLAGNGTLTGNLTYNSSSASNFGGAINGGANTVTIGGTGILTLSGVNNYGGVTAVNSGGLTLAAGGSILNSTAVNVNGGAAGGAALTLSAGNNNQLGNGIVLTLNANNSGLGGSTLTLGGTETIGTLTDNGVGGSTITGTGTLTANTINLDNTTTQVGADLISNGNINVAASNTTTNIAGATTSTAFNVNGGTTNLTSNSNATTTADLNIANNTTFNALNGVLTATNGAGTIDLVGANSNLRINTSGVGTDTYTSLRGIGVINTGGTFFRNNTNLRPGDTNGVNNIGTLTTGGNYRESGNLFIQFNSNAVGPLAPGTSDNIAVGGGFASIDNSSSLRLTDTGGTPVGIGQRYNIINTGGGGVPGPGTTLIGDADGGLITGFGEITDGNNLGPNGTPVNDQFFFDRGTGNIVGLGLINAQGPGAYAGISPNQTAILTALTTTATDVVGNYNSVDAGAGTALDLVYGGPAPGGPITAAQLLANLNQLSPESYAGALDYTLQATRNYVRNATRTSGPEGGSAAIRRTPTSFGGGGTPTVTGTDVFGGFTYLDVESDSSLPGQNYQLQSMGGYAGVRMSTSANLQFGAFLAVDDGSVESTGLDLNSDGMVFGVFSRFDEGPFHAILSGSFSEYEFSGRRTALGGVVNVPEFGSTAWQVGLETGYIVYENAGFTIMPVLGVHYLSADVDGFSETGGPGALTVASQNDSSFLAELGVEFAYTPDHQPWGVEGELGWQHDFQDANRQVSASFGGGGGAPFQVIAPGMGEDAFYLDLRGYYDIGDAVRLGLGYRGELRDDSDILNAGDFRVTYTF